MDILDRLDTQLARRPDWMPDAGIYAYVRDLLCARFDLETDKLPEHWIPLGIIGTMDWVQICGYWVWEHTGVFDTDEPYKWVFLWNGVYEFDPDRLLVFREHDEHNKFH